jgi:hypothetical protein
MGYRNSWLAVASHWQLTNSRQVTSDDLLDSEILGFSAVLAMQTQLDQSTLLKLRTDVTKRDGDAVLAIRLAPEVEMTMCFGFNLKETDTAKRDKLYADPYFGLNFDI